MTLHKRIFADVSWIIAPLLKGHCGYIFAATRRFFATSVRMQRPLPRPRADRAYQLPNDWIRSKLSCCRKRRRSFMGAARASCCQRVTGRIPQLERSINRRDPVGARLTVQSPAYRHSRVLSVTGTAHPSCDDLIRKTSFPYSYIFVVSAPSGLRSVQRPCIFPLT